MCLHHSERANVRGELLQPVHTNAHAALSQFDQGQPICKAGTRCAKVSGSEAREKQCGSCIMTCHMAGAIVRATLEGTFKEATMCGGADTDCQE